MEKSLVIHRHNNLGGGGLHPPCYLCHCKISRFSNRAVGNSNKAHRLAKIFFGLQYYTWQSSLQAPTPLMKNNLLHL